MAMVALPGLLKKDGPELGDQRGLELEERLDGALDLLAGDRNDFQLGLLGVGEEGGVAERLLERLPQELPAILGRPRRQRVGPDEQAVVVNGHLEEAARLLGLGEVDRERHAGEAGRWVWGYRQLGLT